jgi:hypothetical protein
VVVPTFFVIVFFYLFKFQATPPPGGGSSRSCCVGVSGGSCEPTSEKKATPEDRLGRSPPEKFSPTGKAVEGLPLRWGNFPFLPLWSNPPPVRGRPYLLRGGVSPNVRCHRLQYTLSSGGPLRSFDRLGGPTYLAPLGEVHFVQEGHLSGPDEYFQAVFL